MSTVRGSFDVKITPQANDDPAEGATLSRMSLEKRFHGELDAMSAGEMLTAILKATGSAAYVAVERVEGRLGGRTGTFVLLHRGTMTSAGQELLLIVAPGSGTGQLEGLSGDMRIEITDGKHLYEFDYTLPGTE